MGTSLKRKIVVGRRRFSNGHRTVGGEGEDCSNHWKYQMTDFMRSRNMEDDMAEDRHIWRLGMDGQSLDV